jgi:septal ring-binding cell division protein DamX
MGHAGAQAKLGFLYTDGKAVARDHQQAFEWFSQAAKGGNVDGLYNLGIFYLYGWGVGQDTTMAAQYLAAAAALGDEAAEQALPQVLEQIEEEKSRAGPEAVGPNLVRESAHEPEDREQGSLLQDTTPTPEESRAGPAPTVSEAVGGRSAADIDGIPEAVGPNLVRESAYEPEDREQGSLLQDTDPTTEDREQGSLLRDETWIRAQDPRHYTIQVMALRSRDSVEEFMREYAEYAPFAVFTVQKGTQPLHVLLQGSYADIESARAAKQRFPREIQQQDALWVRRFDMVQRLLE